MDGSDGLWWGCLRALRACKELSQSFHEDRLTGLHELTVRAYSKRRSMPIVSSSSYFYFCFIFMRPHLIMGICPSFPCTHIY